MEPERIDRASWPVRALLAPGSVELERADGEVMPQLVGHFAVFNTWTEIRSVFEGEFLERFSPGAFKKTFREQRGRIKVLFQHGRDPSVGDKVLGPVEQLAEDSVGARYEVPLLDTQYNRELLPGLEAGLYGASFRFKPLKVEVTEDAEPSAHNPSGLPEVTVTECSVSEFGPVTFPAYPSATAGIRSLTDELAFASLTRSDRLDELAAFADLGASTTASSTQPPTAPASPVLAAPAGAQSHADDGLPDWFLAREQLEREIDCRRFGLTESGGGSRWPSTRKPSEFVTGGS